MKIRIKMILVFFITTSLLIGIAGFIFYGFSRNELKKLIYAHLETAINSKAKHVKTFLKMKKNCTEQLAESIVVKHLLFIKKENLHYRDELDIAIERFKNTERISRDTYEIFLLNANGKIIASSDKKRIGLDKSKDAYFLGAKKSGKSYIKDAYYSKTTGQEAMAISAPVIDRETGDFLGVIVARIRMAMLNEILSDRTGLGKTGDMYIVNRNGLMITPSRFKSDAFLKLKVDTANTRKHFENIKKFGAGGYPYGPMRYRDYRGVKVLGVHKHLPEFRWILLAEIDEKEVFAPLAKVRFLFAVILIFVPLLTILIANFISSFITRPLHKLHQGMEIVGAGNLDYRVGTKAKDEIGQLSREFDRMAEHLKKTTTSVENLNQEVTERKRIEEKLQESEKRYHSLFESSTDAIMLLDKKGFLGCNKATLEMFGLDKEMFISSHPGDLSPPVQANGADSTTAANEKIKYAFKNGANKFEWIHRRKNGEDFPAEVWLTAFPLEGRQILQATVRDITKRKRAEEKIRYISFHDTLTGLYNRNFFEEEISRLNTRRQYPVSIVIADINGLKFVNDTFGHSQGDKLLKDIAEILRSVSRKEDIVSRIGGDEFTIILPQSDEKVTLTFCNRVKNECEEYNRKSIHKPKLGIALGCATQSGQYKSIDEALKKADESMYAEKMRMKNI